MTRSTQRFAVHPRLALGAGLFLFSCVLLLGWGDSTTPPPTSTWEPPPDTPRAASPSSGVTVVRMTRDPGAWGRSRPSTNSDTPFTILYGTQGEVVGISGGWLEVRYTMALPFATGSVGTWFTVSAETVLPPPAGERGRGVEVVDERELRVDDIIDGERVTHIVAWTHRDQMSRVSGPSLTARTRQSGGSSGGGGGGSGGWGCSYGRAGPTGIRLVPGARGWLLYGLMLGALALVAFRTRFEAPDCPPYDLMTRPVAVVALALFAANELWLRPQLLGPPGLRGILSDVTSMVVGPLAVVLAASTLRAALARSPARRLAEAIPDATSRRFVLSVLFVSAGALVLVNLSPAASTAVELLYWGVARLPLTLTPDPVDLLALLVLPLTWRACVGAVATQDR